MDRGLDVWLVRHGETAWSRDRRYTGWTDVALTASGEDQARALAGRLPTGTDVETWTSDLGRCVATAALAGLVGAAPDERLRELDFGDLDGARWDDLAPEVQASLLDFDGFAAPNGESTAALRDRVHGFLRSLRPGRHVVVTHGGVVRMLLRDAGADAAVAPAEVVRLQFPVAGAAMMTPCLASPSSC
jgi:probable phosphoglycerate mutase